jgi:hypothetical protein
LELCKKLLEPQNRRTAEYRTEEYRTEEVAPLLACCSLTGKLVAKPAAALLLFDILRFFCSAVQGVLLFKKKAFNHFFK